MKTISLTISTAALAFFIAGQSNAASTPKKYAFVITYASKPAVERPEAWVIELGRSPSAEVYYSGAGFALPGKAGQSAPPTKAFGLGALAQTISDQNAVVVNGGFSVGTPSTPDGFLLVMRQILSPLTLAHDIKPPVYHLDSVICLDMAGKMTFRSTGDFESNPELAATTCVSAIQTTPRFLRSNQGRVQNLIPALDPARRKRTVIGFDAKGSAYVVIFSKPIQRYLIAEFLKQKPLPQTASNANPTVLITVNMSGPPTVSEGIGLVDAVGLSSDENAIAVINGKSLTGNMYRQLPSALVFR